MKTTQVCGKPVRHCDTRQLPSRALHPPAEPSPNPQIHWIRWPVPVLPCHLHFPGPLPHWRRKRPSSGWIQEWAGWTPQSRAHQTIGHSTQTRCMIMFCAMAWVLRRESDRSDLGAICARSVAWVAQSAPSRPCTEPDHRLDEDGGWCAPCPRQVVRLRMHCAGRAMTCMPCGWLSRPGSGSFPTCGAGCSGDARPSATGRGAMVGGQSMPHASAPPL